jgi:pimeloyl-ACP methyl ester carboxylesterase
MIEQLESRTLLSGWATFSSDPGGSTGAAADLGDLNGLRRYADSLSKSDRADFFQFSVADKGNFNLALTGLKSNVDVQLLNDNGIVLATSAKKGKVSEKISRFITGGNYFIRVYSGKGFKSSAYHMQLQADVNWGTIGSGSDTKHVGLVFSNDSSQPINRKKETWVLIHGWFAPGRAIALSRLAGVVDKNSKTDQVMLLDWSDAASTANVFDAASRAPAVAQWAADKLKSWGIASSKINIIGHSLGGLVGDMLASKISGGINRMIALDPATDFPGTFFSGVDFAAHSQYSLGFIGSNWSTPEAAATADESFEMNVGPKDSIITHSNVVDLFGSIIAGSVRKTPDAIGKLFRLDSLQPGTTRPFKKDAIDGTYEGTIDGVFKNGAWWPATLTYKNSSGKTVVVRD